MKVLWEHYSAGNIIKKDLEATLPSHKAALDGMKSPERKKAEKQKSSCLRIDSCNKM